VSLVGVGLRQPAALRTARYECEDGFGRNVRVRPVVGAVNPVRRLQPRGKQRVAPAKRLYCLFGVVRPNPHGRQNTQRWLRSGCQPGLLQVPAFAALQKSCGQLLGEGQPRY
jgi:hypothetical protein